MPWKTCSAMDERVRFIARLLEGESMSELCREAGISRKTGYKILNRYKEEGLTAISDRSRRGVAASPGRWPRPAAQPRRRRMPGEDGRWQRDAREALDRALVPVLHGLAGIPLDTAAAND